MWDKIKTILLYIIRFFFTISLVIGYFLSMDFWAQETNIDYGTCMALGIISAIISLYQMSKEH